MGVKFTYNECWRCNVLSYFCLSLSLFLHGVGQRLIGELVVQADVLPSECTEAVFLYISMLLKILELGLAKCRYTCDV